MTNTSKPMHLSGMPTCGRLLGNPGSAAILKSINRDLGATRYFGSDQDPFQDVNKNFIQCVVNPARRADNEFSAALEERMNTAC